jgi:tetratricopeptide (TPR) repeat protein
MLMVSVTVALELFNKALTMRQQLLHENGPPISSTMYSIGSVYRAVGQLDEALTYYERSLEVKLKSVPELHPAVIQNYGNFENRLSRKG